MHLFVKDISIIDLYEKGTYNQRKNLPMTLTSTDFSDVSLCLLRARHE